MLEYLTLNYPIEKQLFLAPKIFLGIMGLYPESRFEGAVLLLAVFNFLVLAYGDFVEFSYGVHYLRIDVVQAFDAFCPVASSIMSIVKMIALWHRRREFDRLIKHLRRLIEVQNGPKKLKFKQYYYLVATRFPFMVMFFGIATSSAYTVRPIIRNVIAYLHGREFLYQTPFNMLFPKFLLAMPFYPFTYLFSHWHGYVTVLVFSGIGSMFLGFCLYFTTLLKCLQVDIEEVLAKRINSKDNEMFATERLIDIIERHNEIADLVEEFSRLIREIVLAHFIICSLIICMCIVDLMLFSGFGTALYILHTCAIVTELFMYCYGGSAIIDGSEEVARAAYISHWYMYNVKIQKMILLLMIRSQRCMFIKVPFFAPSLPVFAAMLRFSGSLIALFKSVL